MFSLAFAESACDELKNSLSKFHDPVLASLRTAAHGSNVQKRLLSLTESRSNNKMILKSESLMKLSRQPVQSTKLRSTQRAPGSAPSFAFPKQRSNLHPPFFVKGTGLPVSLPAETAHPCRDSLLEVAEHQHPRTGRVRVPRLRRLLMQRLTPESQGGGRCEQKKLLLEDRFLMLFSCWFQLSCQFYSHQDQGILKIKLFFFYSTITVLTLYM